MTIAFSVPLVFLLAATGRASPAVVSLEIPEIIRVVAGEFVEPRISVTVAEGYHVQANPSSEDYLVPTRLELKPSGGLTVGKITYPRGKAYRLNGSDKDLQTYDGRFEIGVRLKASSTLRPGEQTVQGLLHYQACDSRTCLFPTSVPLTLRVKVVAKQQKTHQSRDGKD